MVEHSRTSSTRSTSRSTSRSATESPSPTPSAGLSEDWTKLSDLSERRRIQNRLAQRRYRTKLRQKLRVLEEAASASLASMASLGKSKNRIANLQIRMAKHVQQGVVDGRSITTSGAPTLQQPPPKILLFNGVSSTFEPHGWQDFSSYPSPGMDSASSTYESPERQDLSAYPSPGIEAAVQPQSTLEEEYDYYRNQQQQLLSEETETFGWYAGMFEGRHKDSQELAMPQTDMAGYENADCWFNIDEFLNTGSDEQYFFDDMQGISGWRVA